MPMANVRIDTGAQPLVSIVTPVYNNAEYIAECIESVLAQTYQNWDYTIVNNCSTDGSGEIARHYAAKDPRIKVHDNQQFLRAVPNHNNALRQISPKSKYCKVVFADDWIFPQCVDEMVRIAEGYPSVGIVGAYGLWEAGDRIPYELVIKWAGLPYPSRLVPGREICRKLFLEKNYICGTSTSHLYRSDLVRSRHPFYNEGNFHADQEACVMSLKSCDFGFVHQVLTFTRGRPQSLNKLAVDMRMDMGCHLQTLVSHGRDFLSREEYDVCLRRHLAKYYNFLAISLLSGRRDKKFWDFHKLKLNETVGFRRTRLARAITARLIRAALNPYETVEKLREKRKRRKTSDDTGADSVKQMMTSPSMKNKVSTPVRN